MKNNITELVFILDRSGSMAGLESDTIGGFNSMIEKQKKQDGGCYVSTVLLDDESEVLHDRVKLGDIPKMTDNDYTVRCCFVKMLVNPKGLTALLPCPTKNPLLTKFEDLKVTVL